MKSSILTSMLLQSCAIAEPAMREAINATHSFILILLTGRARPSNEELSCERKIGERRSTGSAAHLLDAFRRGLAESGYIEGLNVAIDYRFATRPPGTI